MIKMSHIQEYKKAAAFWNYPEVPYGQALRAMIQPDDVVADIGCGIGMVSQFMAPFCKEVLAIDKNDEVLQSLQIDLQEKSITMSNQSMPAGRMSRQRTGMLLSRFIIIILDIQVLK